MMQHVVDHFPETTIALITCHRSTYPVTHLFLPATGIYPDAFLMDNQCLERLTFKIHIRIIGIYSLGKITLFFSLCVCECAQLCMQV